MNIVLVVMAIGFVLMMLMMFLAASLQDTGAASESTVIHFAQAQQKILLNHVQLIALAVRFRVVVAVLLRGCGCRWLAADLFVSCFFTIVLTTMYCPFHYRFSHYM